MTRAETVWFEITRQFRVPRRLAAACWQEVVVGYTAENRFYHTFAHIDQLLRYIDRFGHDLLMPLAVRMAAILHDARDTEEESAELARRLLGRMRFPQNFIDAVAELILMTKGHRPLTGLLAHDSAILSDCDLLILATPRRQYMSYVRKVRREYSHYDDLKFNTGRRAVLESFSKRDPIFFNPEIHRRYESKARANLEFELQQLAAAAS